ncbi:PREDICTED: uncharacterized protein LOC109206668 [Nicotiana attenuata]|uniref:uncharacterized protein LOC109206668 n=1 Tax=Nicotiana attenuata TaxID=49451 RepID=UPI0009050B40|nr:PREDICTED: uncharacterized protein LOC109206668 [Nicotiana attenuata]
MAPSKQWMQLVDNRLDEAYLIGVQKFLDYAFQKTGEEYEIRCPYVKCCNTTLGTRKIVETHLKVYGIIQNYTFWYHHGEKFGEPLSESEDEDGDELEECESEDEVQELLRDLYPNIDGRTVHIDCDDLIEEEPNIEAKRFYRLLKDFEQPLGVVTDGADLPKSYYEAKKIIQDLGLSYNKIDVCTNDCMLYWKEDSLLDSCNVCGASRWKIDRHSGETRNKKDKRVDDRIIRHPADSMAWKSFDELYPSFATEPRNVRLGLASDGFQPFRNLKTSYSIWHVVLIPYNLPPWLCMKQENFILSMLIPGPDSPGDAIDTYLQPLIEELKELWEVGIETFDASSKQNFKLHASLLWTINDFPAYGNLSGWSTKGKLACPCCNKDTSSIR